MRLRVRHLVPGEIDHELIWLSVSISSLLLAAAWLVLGLAWPICMFHQLTGLPWFTRRMARCAIQFFDGHFLAELKWNPLVFGLLCGAAAYDSYAFASLATRAARL